MTRDDVRLMLRLPADLAARIRRLAEYDARSLNGELVFAIRHYVELRAHEEGTAGRGQHGTGNGDD